MKTFYLLRHGATAGNLERRYIGRTDEALCPEGVLQAHALQRVPFPRFDDFYCSPYLRCLQTLEAGFPGQKPRIVRGMRECDFGLFEGKSADELMDNAAYSEWVASGCMAAIPGGEAIADFKARCCRSFQTVAQAQADGTCTAIVTHGGCIMAVLERFARPERSFYDCHVPNCGWVSCDFDGTGLTLTGGALC